MKIRKLWKAYLKMRRKARFLTRELMNQSADLIRAENRLGKMNYRYNQSITHNVTLAKEIDNLYIQLEKLRENNNE